ncbi:MAG: thiamine pyrophosphate-dependent enzyme [Deltaproteobacteria bacterium]
MRPGHLACPGCGHAIGVRMVLRALGERTIVVIVPSCVAVISGPFPNAAFGVPAFHSAFEIAAPTAAGISSALKIQGVEDVSVVAFAGDGGTFDIGLQSLSGAADRNEDFIYVCMDNEAYMNTGIQVSSATPRFAWTGTSPAGNTRRKKHIMEIMAAHRIPYAATASIGPTGWKMGEHMSPVAAAAAVETNIFPLYEIVDGVHYRLTYRSQNLPVETYLAMQGRFKHLGEEEIQAIQAETDRAWALLQSRADNEMG